jgi:hypothetical protein
MRPTSFRPDTLRTLLLRNKIATLDDLKQALGTPVDITVPKTEAAGLPQQLFSSRPVLHAPRDRSLR